MATIGTGYNSLIGTRQSTASPGVAEYFNTQSGQGFSDPNALSSFVNQNFAGVNTDPNNVFSTLSGGYKAPTAISADTLNQPIQATPFVQPNPTSTPNIDSLFTTPETQPTAQDQQLQAIFDQQQSLNNQLVGKSAFTNQANEQYGVNQAAQTINDLNSQLIQTKNDQAAIPTLLQQNNSSKGIAQPLIDRQRDYLLQQNAIRGLGLSSLMAAAQGQLANAQSLADRAVAAKFDPLQEQLTALDNNAKLIQNSPNYTIAQKNQAQKVQDAVAKQNYQIDLAKQDFANVQQIAMQAAQNGADAQTLQKIQSAKTPIEAAQVSATFMKQKDNVELATSFGVVSPAVNKNGEFFNARTGKAYATPQEFFSAVGVQSFEEAYAKGLVTDINGAVEADREFVLQARAKYPDAGILATDNIQTATQKLQNNSRIYKEATRAPQYASTPSGLGAVSVVDPNIDAQVKQIFAAKPGDGGYGGTYEAVKAKFGEAVANSYDKVYQDVFNKGASIEGAFNNAKLSSKGDTIKLTPAQINSTVNSIAGALDNEPNVKNYNVANEAYQTIKNIGVDTKSPADDIAFIYAFAKIMDPNSVVREGEYNTVQRYAQSWADNFGFKAKRIFSNENFLSKDAKQKMLNALTPKINTLESQYKQTRSEYQRQIDDAYAGKPRTITEYGVSNDVRSLVRQKGFDYDAMKADGNSDEEIKQALGL